MLHVSVRVWKEYEDVETHWKYKKKNRRNFSVTRQRGQNAGSNDRGGYLRSGPRSAAIAQAYE
jgi:hypothetical protein